MNWSLYVDEGIDCVTNCFQYVVNCSLTVRYFCKTSLYNLVLSWSFTFFCLKFHPFRHPRSLPSVRPVEQSAHHCSTRYEQDFDTINIHTRIRKLLQTKIPGTIIKFIANFIKGRKSYTAYIKHTIQHLYSRHATTQRIGLGHDPRRWHHYHIYTHKHECSKKYIKPYLHKVFAWTKQNNFTLNLDKTNCTPFTPDPAEYKSNLDININSIVLPMATHPKVLGLNLDPKLTHIQNI